MHFVSFVVCLAWGAVALGQNGPVAAEPAPLRVEVFVPLCDNALIVCGSRLAGDPGSLEHNLYWGAMYGVERFMLRKGSAFALRERRDVPVAGKPGLLRETVIGLAAKGGSRAVTLTLKAYHGASIDLALVDFLRAAAGESTADLVVWMGHDRLMDLEGPPSLEGFTKRERVVPAIVLACESEQYFGPVLQKLGVPRVAMTRTFMAPEGYLLEALVEAVRGHGVDARGPIREALVAAYARYQKISTRAAGTVFVKL